MACDISCNRIFVNNFTPYNKKTVFVCDWLQPLRVCNDMKLTTFQFRLY